MIRVMAFMPWNYDFVQGLYPKIGEGFLHRVDDRINVNPAPVAHEIRRLVKTESADPDSASVVSRAAESESVKEQLRIRHFPYRTPVFGYVAQWLSEVAGPADLDLLLRHADTYLGPSWSNGGLYYKRCDKGWDEQGNYTYVDPHTGNAGIAYARLNVKDGQKKMWDHPWTKEDVESRPWIDGVGPDLGIDCLRGEWDDESRTMIASFRTWDQSEVSCRAVVRNLPPGKYGVYVAGRLKRAVEVDQARGDIDVDLQVGAEDVDLVIRSA